MWFGPDQFSRKARVASRCDATSRVNWTCGTPYEVVVHHESDASACADEQPERALVNRASGGGRLAFISAITLQSRGADTRADYVQLFRRVLFNILIRNTDDHCTNHGFLIYQRGIRLSPAYDLNPYAGVCSAGIAVSAFAEV